jgi:transcriptional antiterminator RfaH
MNASTEDEMGPYPRDGSWVAVQVQSNMEKKVLVGLKARSYEPLLPTYKALRKWSHRSVEIDLPLFRGYVFCRWISDARQSIIRVPGVVRVVGFGGIPACIDEDEMRAVRRIVDSGVVSQPWSFLQPGDRVRLVSGALSGIEGIFVGVGGAHYVVVNVTMLGRAVAAKIHSSDIAACGVVGNRIFINTGTSNYI